MRAHEFILESEVDESAKQQLAVLGLTAAAALGANKGLDYLNRPVEPASISAAKTIQQLPQDKIQKFNKDSTLKAQPGKKVSPPATSPQAKAPNKPLPPADVKVEIPKNISGHEKILTTAASKAGIKGMELIQFMAQNAHESWGFSRMAEVPKTPDYFAKMYDPKFNPEKAKQLGNTKVGDGEKFKGRGYIQITGRWNYKAAGDALGLPLEAKPELAEKPEVAAKIAVWFWKHRVRPNVNNWQDIEQVTRPINPALRGIEDREQKFYQFQKKYIKKS